MFRKLTILIAIVAVSLTACAGQPVQSAQALTLRARDIAFDATTLEVKANQPVELTYINEGQIDHAFSIEGLLEEQRVKPGETRVFTFMPAHPGTFKIVCTIPGHEMAGMVGTLIVTQQEK